MLFSEQLTQTDLRAPGVLLRMSLKPFARYSRPLLLLILFVLCCAFTAEASHFRSIHNSWKRLSNNSDGSVTVEFTSTQGWRGDAHDMLGLAFGDGDFFFPDHSDISDLFETTDASGQVYTMRRYVTRHTYAATDIANAGGRFLVVSNGCCRIGALINASGESQRIETLVDLNNGNQGSPTSTIPAMLQVSIGQSNTIIFGTADPDGELVRCRFAEEQESGIPFLPQFGGKSLSISPDCVLSWDLAGAGAPAAGRKYAAQIVMEESSRCIGADCGRSAYDFIVEFVQGNAPVCSSDKPVNNTLYVNIPFAANFTGVDADVGSTLTLTTFGAPPTSTLNPTSGSTGLTPFASAFAWTPREADRGSAQSMLVTFKDQSGLQGICSMSFQVSLDDPQVTCSRIDIMSLLLALDGNALAQRDFAANAARTLYRLRGVAKSEYRALVKEAQKLYVQAWSQAWAIPPALLNCADSEFCTNVSTGVLTGPFIASVTQLQALGNSLASRVKATGRSQQARRLKKKAKSNYVASVSAAMSLPPLQSLCPGVTVVIN